MELREVLKGKVLGKLEGKTALITGGSRGIGRAIAVRLGNEGAHVIVHCRSNRAAAEEVCAALPSPSRIVQADLSSQVEIDRLFAELGDAPLDILINNAGVWKPTPLGSTSAGTLDEILSVNLKSVFLVTQAALPRLREGARIINLSSVAGRIGVAGGRSMYGATKAAVDALTKNWALELAPRGIRVNAIAPGYVDTDMTKDYFANAEVLQRALARHPFGRMGTADDVADVALFLCSDESGWITGQSLNASGGFII